LGSVRVSTPSAILAVILSRSINSAAMVNYNGVSSVPDKKIPYGLISWNGRRIRWVV
jgi:hypothetical protein